MAKSLFITGSSGFIGRNFIQKVHLEEYKSIYCLSRNESKAFTNLAGTGHFKFIRGSIYDSKLYEPYLGSSDVVVHLAAATGKVTPQEYFNVNAEGTQFLIKQCQRLGVRNFLYVSSIAVKFPDISRYYYAQSKQLAEDAVRRSGLNYTIVRPTIVIGKEAPIWRSLSRLARAPITFVFGEGTAKIQPIYIGDLVACFFSIIDENVFLNETLDLGGPETITIENFLKRIHRLYYKKDPMIIHIPLRWIIPFLSFIERRYYTFLPFNVGQLSSFYYDGTTAKNWLMDSHLLKMRTIDEMLSLVTGNV